MKKLCSLILRIETIYSALLAVLTSAIVTLCTLGMSQWTVFCILCFFFCIIFLIILIPKSRSYSVFYRKRISNNEDSCYDKAVGDVIKFHYRNNDGRGKKRILGCFFGLILSLVAFIYCSLMSVGNSNYSIENRLNNIENKLDSIKKKECNDTIVEKDSMIVPQNDSKKLEKKLR